MPDIFISLTVNYLFLIYLLKEIFLRNITYKLGNVPLKTKE